MTQRKAFAWAVALGAALTAQAQIEAVWLTHRSPTPDRTVVNWKSARPGPSRMRYGTDPSCPHEALAAGERALHHVEIPTPQRGAAIYYRVATGEQRSETLAFQTCPEDGVRVAVVADWGYAGRPDLTALKADKPHLLMTAGDNVAQLINPAQPGDTRYIQPYLGLIRSEAAFFAATPFMPVTGNHDKQVGPRANKRPGAGAEVYDVAATAFLSVFALPEPGWRWAFTIPQADATFLALDLHHVSDFGTTFQSCHDYRRGSEQFDWFDAQTLAASTGFVVTLMNEKSSCRALEQGAWHAMISRGTLCVTGFGYFAERAVESDGFPYYNTCAAKPGDVYRDVKAAVCERVSSYMLFTFDRAAGRMTAELKRLDGSVIDRQTYPRRRLVYSSED